MNTHWKLNRRQSLALLGLATCPALEVRAQVSDLNDAINKAGRQRMLSQRLAKAWLAMGQEVASQRAEKVLSDSMAVFDRQLTELKFFSPTTDIRSTYNKLEATWGEYKGVLVGARPSAAATPQLLNLDALVLALANQGTQQLEQHGGKSLGKLVNIAGRQRMLSQRMAKFQLALNWKATAADEATQKIEEARREFTAALDTLANAPESNSQIQQQLSLARQQWVFYDAALRQGGSAGKRSAEDLFSASENILQVMDQITGLYSRLTA
jgi:nitrate/nitrite-specific signal transduction histidine kinase